MPLLLLEVPLQMQLLLQVLLQALLLLRVLLHMLLLNVLLLIRVLPQGLALNGLTGATTIPPYFGYVHSSCQLVHCPPVWTRYSVAC